MNETLNSYKSIAKQGLWNNNQALVAMLGLCPLLAVTNNTVNGIGLGISTMAVLIISNLLVSLIRNHISHEIRIPVFVAIIASTVTVIDLVMNAYFHTLHGILGIFIPLIVTNCTILARAESFAFRNTPDKAIVDGFFIGLGFAIVLILLGAIREIVGNGTFLDQINLILGEGTSFLTIHLSQEFKPVILAILPPGAFLSLGLLVALKNAIDSKKIKSISIPVEIRTNKAV